MTSTQSLEDCIVDDRYTVCKSLQSGFYGATWLATDAKDAHKDVCLKVLARFGEYFLLSPVFNPAD